MIIREIEIRDNKRVEEIIRSCLIEFGGNREGLAWEDPYLGRFSEVYKDETSCYLVAEKDGIIVGGGGIGKVHGKDKVCELQKMYFLEEARGKGVAEKLLKILLEFAKKHYDECYLETLSNMEAANKFYKKNGFIKLDKPIGNTGHYSCDAWYSKKL